MSLKTGFGIVSKRCTAILSKTHLPERDREHLTQTWQIERLMGCQPGGEVNNRIFCCWADVPVNRYRQIR
jgi:hypothetical protein